MASFQQLQQQLVQELLGGPGPTAGPDSTSITVLIDALPYYGDPDFEAAHRGALTNLLEVNLPNSKIAGQPIQTGFSFFASFGYSGSFSGYQTAFFSGTTQSSVAVAVAQATLAVNAKVNAAWWGSYGVTVLTDAIRIVLSLPLNTDKLASDLSSNHSTLLSCLSASYCAVFETGFTPTASALSALASAGQTQQACSELEALISSGQFTANVNQAISEGGDPASAAVWFLFNLWITLRALGCVDVDMEISQYSSSGLQVPPEIGPQSWWNGGYATWYAPLSGSDLSTTFQGAITAAMPEVSSTSYGGTTQPIQNDVSLPNGYSQSLCNWGSLNWYKPQSSSCFGKGTGVLMADGSVRRIEEIRAGDQLRTDFGAAHVFLVESPPQADRALYRINELEVYATAGHPFRTPASAAAARLAVEPWSLADIAPTMMFDGIASLAPDSRLTGLSSGAAGEIVVHTIQRVQPEPAPSVCVYDLILERAEGKIPAYYVGGPSDFLAVDAETSDGFREPAATVVITEAMAAAIESCRKSGLDPVSGLGETISQLTLGNAIPAARLAAWSESDQLPMHLGFPDRDFFVQDGKWDLCASMLEAHLVRRFGRLARRETAMGWRSWHRAVGCGDHLTVVVHDLQLVGAGAGVSNEGLRIEFRLRGWSAEEDTVRALAIPEGGPAHLRIINSILDFGRVPQKPPAAALIATISGSHAPLGVFRSDVLSLAADGVIECFVFAPEGRVIGRLALEPRIGLRAHSFAEQQRATLWTNRRALALARALGRRIGNQLAASLTAGARTDRR